jgi:hypothetical protein
MSFFEKLFKLKIVATDFPPEAFQTWPSEPNQAGLVPAFNQLKSFNQDFSVTLSLLEKAVEEVRQEGDSVEYQVVMQSQYGLFTLPCILRKGESSDFIVFYKNIGSWTDAKLADLLQWLIKLRGSDFINRLEVNLCESISELPPKAVEMISSKKHHRMMVSMLPHYSEGDLVRNARVFSEAFAFFYNDKKLLNADETSLQQVEDWYKQKVLNCDRSSFYFSLYKNFLGAYYTQVVLTITKGEFKGGLVVVKADQVRPRKDGRPSGDMRVDTMSIAVDFIFNPQTQNSLTQNLKLILSELV